jgi:hypothetical protein
MRGHSQHVRFSPTDTECCASQATLSQGYEVGFLLLRTVLYPELSSNFLVYLSDRRAGEPRGGGASSLPWRRRLWPALDSQQWPAFSSSGDGPASQIEALRLLAEALLEPQLHSCQALVFCSCRVSFFPRYAPSPGACKMHPVKEPWLCRTPTPEPSNPQIFGCGPRFSYEFVY